MIKLLIFDFDGVFTNGNIIFNNNGEIIKRYNVKDGMGINLLKNKNINVGIISGYKHNNSQLEIIKHLNIKFYSLETKDKLNILEKWCAKLNIDIKDEVAYMGDDINDLDVMKCVKLVACPNDAVENVKKISNFISKKNGGQGCIREFCEYIISRNDTKSEILNEIDEEMRYQIKNFKIEDIEVLANLINSTKKNIYFCGVGKSGNIAKHCCDLLKCISMSSFYLDLLNLTHGDIGTLTNEDIIIMFSNSGNTKEIIDLIPLFKNIGIKKVGICCNSKSRFKELCDLTIITPFNKEISGEIDKIPTNSYMSHLIFSNILVSILKKNITLDKYKENHLAGNIGKNLLKIKDIIKSDIPKIVINNSIEINKILLLMTEKRIGCCCFINENDILFGILTDYDVRKLIIKNNNLLRITKNDINTNFHYEIDLNKFLYQVEIKNKFIPVLNGKKIIGLFRI